MIPDAADGRSWEGGSNLEEWLCRRLCRKCFPWKCVIVLVITINS